MNSTQYFYELTPDRIMSATEQSGLRCTGRIAALNSMENRVYEVEIEIDPELCRSPSDRFRVIKFYRPGRWNQEQIEDEHRFMHALVEADLPVVAPLKLDGGERSLGFDQAMGMYFAVFAKAGGRALDELQIDGAAQLGRLIGRMHAVGRSLNGVHRLKIDEQSFGHQDLQTILNCEQFPSDFAAAFEDIVGQICQRAAPMFAQTDAFALHGDCHLGNIIWNSQGPLFVDFDDMAVAPAIQDLWLVLPGRDAYSAKVLKELAEGYQLFMDVDIKAQFPLIEVLRALRMIHYSAWIAKRWKDPAFPKNFPYFGGASYWSGLLQDLREQLQLIDMSRGMAAWAWPYQDSSSDNF